MAIVLIRTVIIFAALIFFMRLLGKRQLGELEPAELVVSVLIADMAAHPLQDIGIPLLNGLLPVMTLFCCALILAGLTMKSPALRGVLCGKPSILVENARLCQRELKKNRITLDELCEELRNQSITDITKVKYAILETDGKLNLILYPAERPATVSQLGIATDDPGFPSIIINDGKVIEDNLRLLGRDRRWLDKELARRGAADVKDVYLMTMNAAGQIYYAAKEAV